MSMNMEIVENILFSDTAKGAAKKITEQTRIEIFTHQSAGQK